MKLSSLWDISFFRDVRGHLKISVKDEAMIIVEIFPQTLFPYFLCSLCWNMKVKELSKYFPPPRYPPLPSPRCPFFQFDQMWSAVGTISHPSSFSKSRHEAHQSATISSILSGDIRHPSCHSNIFYFVKIRQSWFTTQRLDQTVPAQCWQYY